MWLTAAEALARLGSKPQTLYANVSRGRIRARPDPADHRRSLYAAEDVDRLAERARGRRSTEAVATGTMDWGDPVLPTAISTISGGLLHYRGRDAVRLAEDSSLEAAAGLLWGGEPPSPVAAGAEQALQPVAVIWPALVAGIATATPSLGLGAAALRREAGEVLRRVAEALLGGGDGLLHERFATACGRPEAADTLRRALVLLADHELNPSTFAARVAVSTGASLLAGTLAGLAALSGPLHGDASAGVLALAEDIGGAADAEAALRDWLGEGRRLPGFGHRLYPDGDVRAAALLEKLVLPRHFERLEAAAALVTGERPNIDFALAALVATHELPPHAGPALFALARSVGWSAHMIEQATSGAIIRPRARYRGVAVADV